MVQIQYNQSLYVMVSLSLVSPSAWSSLLLQHGIYFFLQPFLIVGRVHTSRRLETIGNKQRDNTPTADYCIVIIVAGEITISG